MPDSRKDLQSPPVQAQWLSAAEEAGWDRFVAEHSNGSIFQQTTWRNVLRESFPQLSGQVLVLRDPATKAITGGTTVYRARSWLLGTRLVSVPFASHVDPLVANPSDLGLIARCLQERATENRARSAELRFLNVDPTSLPEVTLDRGIKHHHLGLREGLDVLLKKCSRSCVRQWIQKADKGGVTIRVGTNEQDWVTFFRLYAETRRRLQLPVMPKRFFTALARHLPSENRCLLLAEKDGAVLGAGLGLVFNRVFLLEWVGDSGAGRQIGANQRLYWAAVQEAKSRGCETFSFGRTSTSNSGLLEYKRRWGAIESDMPVARWGDAARAMDTEQVAVNDGTLDNRTTGVLRCGARRIIKSAPPWLYYRFSEFCYRHLG